MTVNLPRASVRRPVFTTMVTLMVVIIGAFSLSRLQIDLLPNIELPTLTIQTNYEGASPEVMERLVTQILEEIVATVPGVEEIGSQSSEGKSRITVSFSWGTDIDTAAMDVRSVLEDEINELPDDIVRPRIRKFDINSFPIVILGISSKLDPIELTEIIENQLRFRFSRVPGVAQVDVWGGFNREVRVQLDPDRIKALGLPLSQILAAIENANLDLPTGEIEQGRYEVTLRAPAEYTSLDQIRQTVVAKSAGAAVTLSQVAQVDDTYEKLNRIIRVNGVPGVRVAIRKQAEANTVEVSRHILEEIKRVNTEFPQVKVVPVSNQGNFIERSISNVARSVLYGGGLAVLVLLLFLRDLRSTLVISLAMPISIIATFALIYFGGFTLNLMSLGGLALGVGMMVDSSVVVLENTFRRCQEEGEAPEEAAATGTTEVGMAIIASTLTTLVIFLPLVFVRGVTGVLFSELAYVIIFSLICSLMVSFSLVPMLASKLLKAPGECLPARSGLNARIMKWAENAFNRMDSGYRDFLQKALTHPWYTVFAAAACLGLSLLLLPYIDTEFMPPSDEGEVRVVGEMEVGSRLDLVDRQSRIMEKIIYPAVPELESSVVSVGPGWRRAVASSQSQINLSLKPLAERERSNTEIAADLRRRLGGKVAGMTIRTRAPQGQFLLERLLGGDEGLQLEVRGYDLDILEALANQVAKLLTKVPGVTDVTVSQQPGKPQEKIIVERDKVADMGLSVRDVTQALEIAVAGAKAGEYRTGGNSYRILVQLKDVEKRPLEEILGLTLTTRTGDQVSLNNLVHTDQGRGPVLIERKDQQRIAFVEANVAGRPMGAVAGDVEELLNTIPRPVGYELAVTGNLEEQNKAFNELIVSLILALVLVYMVLACQYESLRDPLVVMFSVPLAAVGVLVILFLTKTTLNLQSYIGCIMLGGIVVNNAILLVDQAGQLKRRGMAVVEAVAEAGRRRLRPILMTTLTTILALLPLAFGVGEGADAQAPLARAVVGGLTGSTLITLVLIPAVYCLFHPDSKKPRS